MAVKVERKKNAIYMMMKRRIEADAMQQIVNGSFFYSGRRKSECIGSSFWNIIIRYRKLVLNNYKNIH